MVPPGVRALLRNTPTIAPVPHRAVLSITGSQAAEFLNGIVASTVPSPGRHFFTAFLHAQGRVLHDAFVYSHTKPDGKTGYLLEYDSRPSEAPPLIPTLKRYILRSKVRLRDVSDEYDVWAAWGSEKEKQWETERQWRLARSGAIEPNWDEEPTWPWGTEPERLRDRRSVGMGHRLLVKKGDHPTESATHDIVTSDAYTLHRILHAVPEGVPDIIPTQSFPLECNLDLMGALDFRKGCYVGQELTVRTYHTGILRKRILPVQITPKDTTDVTSQEPTSFPLHLDIRARLTRQPEEGMVRVRPRGSGKLLSSVGNVGLALLRIQQIEAAEGGEADLEIETTKGENTEVRTWTVKHWRPESWPLIQSEPGS